MPRKRSPKAVVQASKVLDATYIIPMDTQEARKLADSIKGHLDAADAEIIELHDREGYKALGYTSWRECIQNEFQVSRAQGYRLLEVAKVRHGIRNLPSGNDEVSPIGDILKNLNDGQIRELARLKTPEERVEVYREVEAAKGGGVTAADLRAAIQRRLGVKGGSDQQPPPSPARPAVSPYKKGEQVVHIPTGFRCTVVAELSDGTLRLVPVISTIATRGYDWVTKRVPVEDVAYGHMMAARPISQTRDLGNGNFTPDPPTPPVEEGLSKREVRGKRGICTTIRDLFAELDAVMDELPDDDLVAVQMALEAVTEHNMEDAS